MTPRNTSTGAVLEDMILRPLDRAGYQLLVQQKVGQRPGGRPHVIDVIAEKDGAKVLVSLKWQQTSGTAEQKVPFEVMCLADALEEGHGARAYLVLGGEGWTLRDYFTSGALTKHLLHADRVRVVTLERFVGLANGGQL